MTTDSYAQIAVGLAFPNAGVVFNITVEPPSGASDGQPPAFHLAVTDASNGQAVPFSVDASAHLADWVRGYSRWLVRARVRATCDENSITGTFFDGLAPEQVLQGVRDACDMIRQRFDLYQESVLS